MTREMKNSGVQWIGEIPSNWGMSPNKYLMHKIKQICPTYNGEDILSLSVRGVNVRDLDAGGKMPTTFDGYQRVYKGNLLMCLFDMDVTPCCIGRIKNDGLTSPAYSQFVVHKDANRDYYYYHYLMLDNTKELVHLAKNLRHSLTEEQLGNIKLPLPPLNEQKAIADFLDAKCGEIDGLLADLDTEVKTLAEYKKSLIAETVTRGLNPNAPMKQSGIPWADTIPAHWKVIANKYIMRKKKEIVPVYSGQDIISLSMNGVIVRDLDAGGKMPTSFNGYQQIYPGNLLMCLFDIDVTPRCIGLIKNKGLTSPAYSQFEMIGETYAPYYYYFYLKMDNTKELVHLSKNMRHSLNEEQFGMIKTIQPPIEEQVAIADFLDTKCAAIDQAITDKTTQIETLKAYKSSLIYEYVTGKKQVAL